MSRKRAPAEPLVCKACQRASDRILARYPAPIDGLCSRCNEPIEVGETVLRIEPAAKRRHADREPTLFDYMEGK